MPRQSKEVEEMSNRYCKKLGMVPSTVHCQVIQKITKRDVLTHALLTNVDCHCTNEKNFKEGKIGDCYQ